MVQRAELVFFLCKEMNVHVLKRIFFFHFVKIDSRNNKSNMNLKTSQFGNGYKYKNKHVLPRMISPTTSLSTVLDL
jgi:hypothetical protein